MQTIVLTKEFFRLRKIQYTDAIGALLSGRAKPVHGYTIFYSLNDWFKYARGIEELNTRVVRSVDIIFYVPEFMVFLNSSMPLGSTPNPTRTNIWLRDSKKCAYCGVELEYSASTVDHVIPTAKGGKHKWDNIAISCKSCNNKKGDKYLEDTDLRLRVELRAPSWMELIAKRDKFGFV